MANDSSQPGYITPLANPAPLEDEAFENFLEAIICGITGMDQELVRPRWQPEPPNQPDRDVDWIAFGIMRQSADAYSFNEHVGGLEDGSDNVQRHEDVEILLSSYGPNGSRNLGWFRDGLLIDQNRDALTEQGMGQTSTGEIVTAPALIKGMWYRRFDMSWRIKRQIRRTYAILTLLTANGILYTQGSANTIETPLLVEQQT